MLVLSSAHIDLYIQPTTTPFQLGLRSGEVSDYVRRLMIDSFL